MCTAVADTNRVAIGCRFRAELSRDNAVIAGTVIDDQALPERLAHFRHQQAGLHIGRTGWRGRNEYA
jgi:hypothetical protein